MDSFNHRVQKFSKEGAFLAKWGSRGSGRGEFDTPWGIAIDGAGAVYVADMSGMPELIRQYVAIPLLRKRGYTIGVDQSGSLTRDFPSHEKQPTLLVLDGLRITRLEQLASIEAVRTALAQLKAPETAAPAAPAEN